MRTHLSEGLSLIEAVRKYALCPAVMARKREREARKLELRPAGNRRTRRRRQLKDAHQGSLQLASKPQEDVQGDAHSSGSNDADEDLSNLF